MSHSLSSVDLKDVPEILAQEPIRVRSIEKGMLWAFLIAGILSLGFGLMDETLVDTTWLCLHVNAVFWFDLAIASAGFSAVFHISNSQWSRPIRRLFESTSAAVFWFVIPLVALRFGYEHLFGWAHDPSAHNGRGMWLDEDFLFTRVTVAALLIAWLVWRIVKLSVARDIVSVRSGITGINKDALSRWFDGKLNHYALGTDTQALATVEEKMSYSSPVVVIFYALCISVVAFDVVMSVDPHWYSTLFGALIFMSAVYSAVAWQAVCQNLARDWHPIFRKKIERRTLHDLGKLLFGFGIFWAYMFWSHYLTIWYGNIPEETHWVIVRLREEPWHGLAWLVLGCSFIIPFLLGLSRDLKQVPQLLLATGVIVLFGQWLQIYLLIVPFHYPDIIPLSVHQVLITFGFMAALLLLQIRFLSRVPLIPFGDLYLTQGSHAQAAHEAHGHA